MIALGLLLALLNTVSGVNLGGECWSTANGVAAGGCAQGTQCGPWGGSWDNSSPWYCVAYPKLQAGATCDDANKVGPCDTGLSCISGICTDPSSVPTSPTSTSTDAPSTSTSTSTDAPTTSTSTSTSTDAPTTAPPCTFEGGEICMDTNQPAATFENKCCRSPYTCESITSRTSMCGGKDLPQNSTCWSDASGSSGTCDSSTICKTPTGATRGVCTKFEDNSTCVATGVAGYNICYNSDVGLDIKGQNCCDDFNTGDPDVGCRPDYTNAPTGDRYCMPTKLAVGASCGWTAASNYAGMCDRTMATDKLECIDGLCAVPGATTSTVSTTSTTAPPCSGKGAKCYDADTANYVAGVTCCNGAVCQVTSNPYDDAYCPDAAGAPTCTTSDGDETGLTGTKCFDGAASPAALIATVKCCYGPCSLLVADGTNDGVCTDAPPAPTPAPAPAPAPAPSPTGA